ncbi:Retrovirus-related Pol polyprotein from transposon TNT 1-94 [Hibiscus syriacus]|uniref:Retrovirus-related Pol polyprotein from transposon TNT 1-94 n=1 Tax=Hibiscus syriacus TaxID=106335 RepID=A0A6A3B509_HIBSY|nr:Retrovirus-related Pol polyprotein from transposon TNT 1-94 [Hibiscus syriacus]
MASTSGSFHMEDSLLTDKPPYFNGVNYSHWKKLMKVFIQSNDLDAWEIIENGYSSPKKKKKKKRVSSCSSAKELWNKLEEIHGNKKEEPTKVVSLMACEEPEIKQLHTKAETKEFVEFEEISGNDVQINPETVQEEPGTPELRRSSIIPKPTQRYSPSLHYLLLTDNGEPKSYDEAMQTWELAELPPGKKALHNKWIYRIKEEHDGSKRNKARLVVKGFQQKEGIDYNEIFSPVVKLSTIRLVLKIVAAENLHLEQLDVKTAFLHGDLEEEIYMRPEGFIRAGKKNLVCRLKKSLYGLKQAPRQWYKKFDSFMSSSDFTRCQADHFCYIKSKIIEAVCYEGSGCCKADSGMRIKRQNLQRTVTKDGGRTAHMVKVSYASVIGSLMYVMVCTRPDIAHAVELLDSAERSKLDAKSNKCAFVGYGDDEFGYRIWDYENRKIIRSRDVIFNENVMYKDSSRRTRTPELRRSSIIPKPTQRYSPSLHYFCDYNGEPSPMMKLCKWRIQSSKKRSITSGSTGSKKSTMGANATKQDWCQRFSAKEGRNLYEAEGFIRAGKKNWLRHARDYKLKAKIIEAVCYEGSGFNMQDAKPVSTPLGVHFRLSKEQSPKTEEERAHMVKLSYASAIGSPMYVMVCTRPDIAHAVGAVSRYMNNPGKVHLEAVKWILRYLRGTTNKALCFKGGDTILTSYVDADLAGNIDIRRSTTGYIYTLGGTTVSWVSQLQKIVALSTTEAEYVAVTDASKEMVWLQSFLEELGKKQENNVLYCNSQSVIHLAKNSSFHSRTKHIQLRYHFIRSLLEDGILKLEKISGAQNPADMLTKTELTDEVFAQSKNLFHLPLNEKMELLRNEKHRGYTPVLDELLDPDNQVHGQQTLSSYIELLLFFTAGAVGDYKEGYYIGVEVPEDDPDAEKPFYGPNVWPEDGRLWKKFHHETLEVAKAVARIIALALGCLEVEFFNKPEMFGKPIATLQLLHYEGGATSTLHRVLGNGQERYSIAYFVEPSHNCLVECLPTCKSEDNPPKFPSIRCATYLSRRYKDTHAELSVYDNHQT